MHDFEFWFDGTYESLNARARLEFNGDGLDSFELYWVKDIEGNLIQITDTIQRQASKSLFANEQAIAEKIFDNEPDYSMDDVLMTRV